MAGRHRSQARKHARRRAWLNEWKLSSGCVDCGYDEHPEALQFDHVRGEKFADVPYMLSYSLDKLWAEIMKCEVVCANCHAVRTQARRLEVVA